MGLIAQYYQQQLAHPDVQLLRRDRPRQGPYISIGPDGYPVEACLWVDGRPTSVELTFVRATSE